MTPFERDVDHINWTVWRHSGWERYGWRIKFRGSHSDALEKYRELVEKLRQGGVNLVNPEGQTEHGVRAPRLRTRW